MLSHPFIETKKYKIAVTGIVLLALAAHSLLLFLYGDVKPAIAIIDGVVSISLLGVLCYILWYTTGIISVPQAEIIIAVIAITVWIAGTYIGQNIIEEASQSTYFPFLESLPLRLLMGISLWTICGMWYRIIRLVNWKEERITAENIRAMQTEEITNRIAVKDGTRINIIPLPELIYVQASGDYITLVTPRGQFLKEQTMKSLSEQLPAAQFVRIHRSYIVNVEYIKKVELHGKESYLVFLKNDDTIKASSSGYKLLREKLSL